jgi:hypothetical protein
MVARYVLAVGLIAAPAQASDFLGEYSRNEACAGEPVSISDSVFVMDDFGCEVSDIKSRPDGTFEIVTRECIAEGGTKSNPVIYGYARGGKVIALSFDGPQIPLFPCP